MCVICKDWIQGLLTANEAHRNLAEMAVVLAPDHVDFVELLIADGLPTTKEEVE